MTLYREDRSSDILDGEAETSVDNAGPRSAVRDRAVVGDLRPQGEPLIGAVLDLVHDLDEQVTHLKAALQTNRRIGIAMGIVMSQFRISDEEAFAALRHVSQNGNRKLHDVAEDVIYAGHLTVDR